MANTRQKDCSLAAFSLIELLVVVAIIAILASLLLPNLARAKLKGKQTACVSNLKQLGVAFNLYCADNDGKLPENLPGNSKDTPSWVMGDMRDPMQATNEALLRQGKLFPYASQTAVYHCPADMSRSGPAPRTRSFSMNSWMGSREMETQSSRSAYRTFVRDSELSSAATSSLWVFIDERETTIDDGWFLVTMDDSRPFASAPATRHQEGYMLSFADGHAELYKLRTAAARLLNAQIAPYNLDWLRLKQITTVR